MATLLHVLKKNYRVYLMEAWALGMFMISAGFFVLLIEHPDLPMRNAVEMPILRRLLTGLAMGATAVGLIYSGWGKKSGAHMNPAVTLTFLSLHRICREDALWYIVFQFAGALSGMLLLRLLFGVFLAHPAIHFITTLPGDRGLAAAFAAEFILSFSLLIVVLIGSNYPKIAPRTGYLVGFLLTLFITFISPLSGMSINPARSFAAAAVSGIWHEWWLYFAAPVAGMLAAGFGYRTWYRVRHKGDCTTMRMHVSGEKHDCVTYDVFGPVRLLLRSNSANSP